MTAVFLMVAFASVSAAPPLRTAHTATLLANGDVLIAGGVDENGIVLDNSDLIATANNSVINSSLNLMSVQRASHTATLLPNGCVLVAGGNRGTSSAPVPTNQAEIYNPQTRLWSLTGSMGASRYSHTATLLYDGRVLICGGQSAGDAALSSCELYDATSCNAGSFVSAPPLLQARHNHAAVLLTDGKVWFAGGRNPLAVATGGYLPTTERYDPVSNAFQSASPLIEARSQHSATLLGDGKVLVVGGYNARNVFANNGITESAEIYDPISNSVTPAGAMSTRRQSHTSVLSANGEVSIFGGLGNITTTYILGSALNLTGNTLKPGSVLNVGPTLTITPSNIEFDIDFLLNKPVIGRIADGEVWLSSPSVMPAWGAVRFTPASEITPTIGLRIDLANSSVGCRLPGNDPCGNILKTPALFKQTQGNVVFYPRVGVAFEGSPNTNASSIAFTPTPINQGAPIATLTSSNFTANVTVLMDKAFDGHNIKSGTLNLTNATLIKPGNYTVDLTGGQAILPADIGIVLDPTTGNATATFMNLRFNSLTGNITFTSVTQDQEFTSPQTSPMTITATANMSYATDGANLVGETFIVDVATVVIRKMVFADTETYTPKTNSWVLAPRGSFADLHRYGHSATLLPNNDTLFYGGSACAAPACATQVATSISMVQELYSEKNFAIAPGLAANQRAFHTSTLLPNGDILVAGGTNGPSILNNAELFSPTSETFAPTAGPMRHVRDLHTATLMPNGRVLLAGGFTTNETSTGSTNTVEIYYPDTRRFIETTPMISSRSNHGAILLPDGRIFTAGGFGAGDVITATAEIYITTESRWIPSTLMPVARAIHATVQLKTGKILLIGGVNADGPLNSAVLYDPAANSWNALATMPTALRSLTATLLFDGRVLVVGGNDGFGEANKSFIYNPLNNTWAPTHPNPLLEPRFNHTATLLPNGNVMISGGSQRFGNVPKSIEVFHVNGSSWVSGGGTDGVKFADGGRAFHTMTLALNNKIYAIGGSNGAIGGVGVALYNTAEAGFFGSTADSFSKDAPPSARKSTITTSYPTPLQSSSPLIVNGNRFRGRTDASGGGSASANSASGYPRLILQQVDGSGGSSSQSNGGFAVDLSTQIFLQLLNKATLDTALTVALPQTSGELPLGWYALRTGANGIYSDAKMISVGPPKPILAPVNMTGVAAGISSMTWSWDSISGVDGYNVYNATTGIFISSSPVSLMPRATFIQTALDPGATTSILVAGYTLSGDGPLSSGATAHTLNSISVSLSTTPLTVTISSVAATNLLISWSTNSVTTAGTIYEVSQSSDDFITSFSTPVPTSFNLTSTFTAIAGLSVNTTYYFRLRAFQPLTQLVAFSNSVTTITLNGGAAKGSIAGPLKSNSQLSGTLGNGRRVLLRASANAFPSEVTVTISSFNAVSLCPNSANIAFAITNAPAFQPTGSLYLTFGFTPAELGSVEVNRALLLRYDPGSGACVPLETTIDAANGEMTARINHFSLFQVGSVPLATTTAVARLYPNPYYAGRDGFVTIDTLPPGARVRVFTLRGELTLDVKANSSGLVTWSGNNGAGRAVASGVYLVLVESGGTKNLIKLAVIR